MKSAIGGEETEQMVQSATEELPQEEIAHQGGQGPEETAD